MDMVPLPHFWVKALLLSLINILVANRGHFGAMWWDGDRTSITGLAAVYQELGPLHVEPAYSGRSSNRGELGVCANSVCKYPGAMTSAYQNSNPLQFDYQLSGRDNRECCGCGHSNANTWGGPITVGVERGQLFYEYHISGRG